MTRCAREFGDHATARLGRRNLHLVSHPDLIEELLVSKADCFSKHFVLHNMRRLFGKGLITGSGEQWRIQRKMSQPMLQRERFLGHVGEIVDCVENELDAWAYKESIDLQEQMSQLTLRVIARFLFGADLSREASSIVDAVTELQQCAFQRNTAFLLVPFWVPTAANLLTRWHVRKIERVVRQLVEHARQQVDLASPLKALIDAHESMPATPTPDAWLRDMIVTLLMAGHETTAGTLEWLFILLTQHPDVEQKLHHELDEVLGDRPITAEDIPRLKYTGQVVTETLRLYPTVWIIGREATKPCQLGGAPIACGDTILTSQWVVHRDPRFYDDPESYRPDRWAEPKIADLPRLAYFPYGAGAHSCTGATASHLELILLTAMICRRFRVRLTESAVLKPFPSLTIRATGPVSARLEPRAS